MTEEQKPEAETPKAEPELINLKELAKGSGLSKDKLEKLALVCLNCGHKDLLINFADKQREETIGVWDEGFKPIPRHRPQRVADPFNLPQRFYGSKTTGKIKLTKAKSPNALKVKLQSTGTIRKGMSSCAKKVSNMVLDTLENQDWHGYEDYFKCPKCQSAMVSLDDNFVKNNLLRGLDSGDGEK